MQVTVYKQQQPVRIKVKILRVRNRDTYDGVVDNQTKTLLLTDMTRAEQFYEVMYVESAHDKWEMFIFYLTRQGSEYPNTVILRRMQVRKASRKTNMSRKNVKKSTCNLECNKAKKLSVGGRAG